MSKSISERQDDIRNIKNKIKKQFNIETRIEKATTGRNGTLLYASINKKGVRGLEVISFANGDILMGIAVKNDKSSTLVKEIMNRGDYILKIDQKNPRYEFDVEKFGEVYDLLINHPMLND